MMRRDPYQRFASGYDKTWARFSARTHAQVLAQLPQDCAGQRLLDLSCGTGSLIERILLAHPASGPIMGVDVSAGMRLFRYFRAIRRPSPYACRSDRAGGGGRR